VAGVWELLVDPATEDNSVAAAHILHWVEAAKERTAVEAPAAGRAMGLDVATNVVAPQAEAWVKAEPKAPSANRIVRQLSSKRGASGVDLEVETCRPMEHVLLLA